MKQLFSRAPGFRGLRSAALIVMTGFALGCGDEADPAVDAGNDVVDDGYAPGPYGANIGDTIPNFTFQGYFAPKVVPPALASQSEFGEITMARLRDTGAKGLFFQSWAPWCGGCNGEAEQMSKATAGLVAKNGVLFGVMTQGNAPSTVATKAEMDDFIASIKIPFSMALDSTGDQPPMEAFFGNVSQGSFSRAISVIIDLRTMKIVNIRADFYDLVAGNQGIKDFEAFLDGP